MHRLKQCVSFKRQIKWLVYGTVNTLRYVAASRSINTIDFSDIQRIHFVCKGNICRSPFAEKIALRKIKAFNLPVEVISSGIDADQANASPQDAVHQATKFGIELDEHRPKKINRRMVDTHTLIIGMHLVHFLQLRKLYPEFADRIFLLRHFGWNRFRFIDIQDPFNKPPETFFYCFSDISYCVDGLVSRVVEGYQEHLQTKKGLNDQTNQNIADHPQFRDWWA